MFDAHPSKLNSTKTLPVTISNKTNTINSIHKKSILPNYEKLTSSDEVLVPATPLIIHNNNITSSGFNFGTPLCPDSLEELPIPQSYQKIECNSSELLQKSLHIPKLISDHPSNEINSKEQQASITLPLSMWSPSGNEISPSSPHHLFRNKNSKNTNLKDSIFPLQNHLPLSDNNNKINHQLKVKEEKLSSSSSCIIIDEDESENIFRLQFPSNDNNEKNINRLSSEGLEVYLEESNLDESFTENHNSLHAITLSYKPPKQSEIMETFINYNLPQCEYQEAYYGEEKDCPTKPKTFAGRTFKIPIINIELLPDFEPLLPNGNKISFKGITYWKFFNQSVMTTNSNLQKPFYPVTLSIHPPTRENVKLWLDNHHKNNHSSYQSSFPIDPSQIDGPTPPKNNPHGFFCTQNTNDKNIPKTIQHITTMSIEIHVNTRGSLKPNPNIDSVTFIAYSIQNDDEDESNDKNIRKRNSGIILIDDKNEPKSGYLNYSPFGCKLYRVENENELFNSFIEIVRKYDPDIFVGYEVQNSSIGYLIERAKFIHRNLCMELGRISTDSYTDDDIRRDEWGFTHGTGIKIPGRIILNLWRILRGEVKANIYTFENMVYHILHKRIPYYNEEIITKWFKIISIDAWKNEEEEEQEDIDKLKYPKNQPIKNQVKNLKKEKNKSYELFWLSLQYVNDKCFFNIKMLDQLDIIGRTSELARLYGIDFYSVLSRGSQYRVESMTLRMTRPQNYVLLSPGKSQVNSMKAPECLPLVMEPESQFYTNPVLVFDFQSLYPSIIIAYNLCYSTCLGKMTSKSGEKKFGVTSLDLPVGMLSLLGQKNLTLTPNEVLFTSSQVRKGILPRLLQEILNTRVMIKNAMKQMKGKDSCLYKQLDARQFGLKMIANVTYGYTSASFSGRMPCVDIADSIVQTARETLEKAIRTVEIQWKGAKVVYGDTDSLFVEIPGVDKQTAFKIGNEIAKEITNLNPYPVKLKFEKVYLPCILVSKKRYVGYMYESIHQEEPIFDAKGIETVRRDSCLLVSKIMEKSIRMLFEKKNLSIIKSYLYKQWSKIIQNRCSIYDFIFSKEVRLGTYSNRGPPPPAALVCMKKIAKDPRAEPQYGERVPYVVICGNPNSKLFDLVIDPHEVIFSSGDLIINSMYYITKQIIPSLSRLFCLLGVDIKSWFIDMPQKLRLPIRPPQVYDKNVKKVRIEQYYVTRRCPICDNITNFGICSDCQNVPQFAALILSKRIQHIECKTQKIRSICVHCSNVQNRDNLECSSLDCTVFFERMKLEQSCFEMRGFNDVIEKLKLN